LAISAAAAAIVNSYLCCGRQPATAVSGPKLIAIQEDVMPNPSGS
jgi:hypothetical protein